MDAIKNMVLSKNINLTELYKCFKTIDIYKNLMCMVIPKGVGIIRARINQDKFFDDINQLSYPPNDKCKLMRVTLPGHSMFYGALPSKSVNQDDLVARAVVLYEISDEMRDLKFSGKQVITFGKWLVTKPIKIFALPISENYKKYTYDTLNIKDYWDNCFSSNIDLCEKELLEYLGDLMAEKGSNIIYEVTANFVHYVLNNVGTYQGIIYPTQQLDGEGINVALTPHAIDSCCNFDYAMTCIIEKNSINSNMFNVAHAKWDANGHIRWVPDEDIMNVAIKQDPEIVKHLNLF